MRKTEKINFRCGEMEAAAIRRNAETCGLSTSDYCRQVILGYRPRKKFSEVEFQMLSDVRKLCMDMTHITNFFRQKKYDRMMKELKQMVSKLKSILYDSKSQND